MGFSSFIPNPPFSFYFITFFFVYQIGYGGIVYQIGYGGIVYQIGYGGNALNKRMLDLVTLSVQEDNDAEDYEDDFKNISAQIEQLSKRITAIRENEGEDGELQARIKEIQDTIDKRKENKDTYDDSIVRQMVECIKVYHDGRLQIILGGGYELEEYLEK